MFDGEPSRWEHGAPWNWDDEAERCACAHCISQAWKEARDERLVDDWERDRDR